MCGRGFKFEFWRGEKAFDKTLKASHFQGERDAFDTLFDYGPDKLAHVKSSLLAFCNKHLNKINLEVTDLENQFQDGVYLVLLMGLLEGYFVPLYSFYLQVNFQRSDIPFLLFNFFWNSNKNKISQTSTNESHFQVVTHEQKVHNVRFAYQLMYEAGLQRPRARVQDIVNGDLKSTLRILHSLFTRYKHV